MPKIIPISDDPHYADFAELPHFESWDEKITRRMKQDREAKYLDLIAFTLALIFGVALFWPF